MVSIAFIQPDDRPENQKDLIQRIITELSNSAVKTNFIVMENAELADVVVFLQTNTFKKSAKFIPIFQNLRYLSPNYKLICYSREDCPAGFLPGMYTSLNTKNFDPRLHIVWPSATAGNASIRECSESLCSGNMNLPDSKYLFSFLGSASDKFRRRIFDHYSETTKDYFVKEIDRWFDHTDDEEKNYADVILKSKFVLCPRGYAPYSHRILETLSLGRVPVVLADDWVPFSIEETGYYVQVPERHYRELVKVLGDLEEDYPRMQKRAFAAFQNNFSYRDYWPNALNKLFDFYSERLSGLDGGQLISRMNSYDFKKSNDLHLSHRVLSRMRSVLKSVVK